MAPSLTIGEVARSSGVAAKTIRYYEQIGVLPAPTRAASGYRLYDQSGVERLRFIRRARSLGLPLQELKALIGTLNGGARPELRPRLRALVRAQLDAVVTQIAELERLRRQLEHILQQMRTAVQRSHGRACQCLETSNGPGRRRETGLTRTSETTR
jgi:MerR family gold-responsive transcriptional activator of gol and ges genes